MFVYGAVYFLGVVFKENDGDYEVQYYFTLYYTVLYLECVQESLVGKPVAIKKKKSSKRFDISIDKRLDYSA